MISQDDLSDLDDLSGHLHPALKKALMELIQNHRLTMSRSSVPGSGISGEVTVSNKLRDASRADIVIYYPGMANLRIRVSAQPRNSRYLYSINDRTASGFISAVLEDEDEF